MNKYGIYVPGAFVGAFLVRIGWELGGFVWLKLIS